jgi:hypothetical protein
MGMCEYGRGRPAMDCAPKLRYNLSRLNELKWIGSCRSHNAGPIRKAESNPGR